MKAKFALAATVGVLAAGTYAGPAAAQADQFTVSLSAIRPAVTTTCPEDHCGGLDQVAPVHLQPEGGIGHVEHDRDRRQLQPQGRARHGPDQARLRAARHQVHVVSRRDVEPALLRYASGVGPIEGTATCASGTQTRYFSPRAPILATSSGNDMQKVAPSGALEGTASPWQGSNVTASYKWKWCRPNENRHGNPLGGTKRRGAGPRARSKRATGPIHRPRRHA
jgi:hypothetical protein